MDQVCREDVRDQARMMEIGTPAVARAVLVLGTVAGIGMGAFLLTRALTGGDDSAGANVPTVEEIDIRAEGPDFAGKVLHWREMSVQSTPGVPDPANGQAIMTDIWVEFGPLNVPTRVRTVATFEDGGAYQAQLLFPDQGLLLFGHKVPGSEVPGDAACSVTLSGSASLANMEGIRPFFIDSRKAEAAGLVTTATGQPITRPALTASDKALSSESEIDSTEAVVLDADLPQGDLVVHVREEIDSKTGLQLSERVVVTDRAGSPQSESLRSISAIQVFRAGEAPPDTFDKDSLPGVNCE